MDPISLDRGVQFGIGVFETIAVCNYKALFLPFHLERLEHGMKTLGIQNPNYSRAAVMEKMTDITKLIEKTAVKIMVTDENFIIKLRKIPYTDEDYEKGFRLCFSDVLRNETSPLTYLKTVNCADLILEKGRAKERGFDEPIFFNSRGEVTEGAVTNLFCVKNGQILTPSISCGILNGTVREFLLSSFSEITETTLTKEDLLTADELFLTNSLMGVMPVISLEDYMLPKKEIGQKLLKEYLKTIES